MPKATDSCLYWGWGTNSWLAVKKLTHIVAFFFVSLVTLYKNKSFPSIARDTQDLIRTSKNLTHSNKFALKF